jgi:hypothetical protein
MEALVGWTRKEPSRHGVWPAVDNAGRALPRKAGVSAFAKIAHALDLMTEGYDQNGKWRRRSEDPAVNRSR